MASNTTTAPASRHRLLSEIHDAPMAKADLRKPEKVDFREQIGACVNAARLALGWSLKEFAARLDREERQVARWLNGHERVHLDALWGLEEIREPFLIALARLHGYASVKTTVEFERR